MNITKVTISKLFGIFNHEISFNQDSGVTIILGENGIGKTKILEVVNAVFNNDFNFLIDLEFENLSISFDSGEAWEFIKLESDDGPLINIARKIPGQKYKHEKFFGAVKKGTFDFSDLKYLEMRLDHYTNEMLALDRMRDRREFEKLLYEREIYENRILRNREKIKPPKWFLDESNKIKVRLIETQRIITRNEAGKDSYRSMVKHCSSELKDFISNAIKSSADITSALDSTYPNRLVKRLREKTDYTYAQLNEDLSDLNEKRKSLSADRKSVV